MIMMKMRRETGMMLSSSSIVWLGLAFWLLTSATTCRAFAPPYVPNHQASHRRLVRVGRNNDNHNHNHNSNVIQAVGHTHLLMLASAQPPQQQQQEEEDNRALTKSNMQHSVSWSLATTTTTAAQTVLLWTSTAAAAVANDSPDWGIFEGRLGSLLHPTMMGGLLLYSIYTALLGFQWRRQRTMGNVIQSKQQELAKIAAVAANDDEGSSTSSSSSDNDKNNDTASAQNKQRLQQEIAQLQQERKDLAAAAPRDRHFAQGALLACLGTLFAIEGPLNTYARAGKLFPGPHLYVGASLVCLWAIAVATVPAMQKGNDTARTLHIGANLTGLALFAWQVQSGLPILFKVIELTKWP